MYTKRANIFYVYEENKKSYGKETGTLKLRDPYIYWIALN